MILCRTTIRLDQSLKKQTDLLALEQGLTFQDLVHKALHAYLNEKAKKNARKLVFHTHDLGVALTNLTRDNFYDAPKTK